MRADFFKQVACKIFSRGSEWHDLKCKALLFQTRQRLGSKGALLHQKLVVKGLYLLAHSPLKYAKIHHHIAHSALMLQLFLLHIHHYAPAMPMQVLAFAVVVGQKMGAIKARLCL